MHRASTGSINSSTFMTEMNCLFECSSGISEGGFLPGKRSKKHLSYISCLVPSLPGDFADNTGYSTKSHGKPVTG